MAKNRLNFEAHLSRHSHNVNAGYASTLTTGPIVPQYFDILQPGDTLYIEPSMFVRLQDVVTAFFGRVDVHMDAFFVPLSMLYTNFGSIFTQTDDKISSLFSEIVQSEENFPILQVANSVGGIDLRTSFFNGAECKGKEFMRLLDALDLNPFVLLNASNQSASGHTQTEYDFDANMMDCPNICPWIPAAYQAIYQKHYRNEEFERRNIRAYNFDRFYQNVQTAFVSQDFLRLRYHQRLSDYFTDVRVSPIASAVNQYNQSGTEGEFPDGGSTLDSVLYNINNFLSPSDVAMRGQKFDSMLSVVNSPSSLENVSITQRSSHSSSSAYDFLNTSSIRSLFALDKYLRIWGRAGKSYDDQILAHFGVKIPHDVKHDLTHVKHWQSSLAAEPVYSTANIPLGSEGGLVSTLGQVGAQSQTTVGGSSVKFKAPVHGVFMIVAYALTKPLYECSFSKLHLLYHRLSFPIPEYDKLGAQPLYYFEFDSRALSPSYIGQIAGWQNRYEEFKRKYNRCSFTFGYKSLNFHVPNVSNALAPWILQRYAFEVNTRNANILVPGSQLFERPDSLNSVMVRQFDGSWHDDYFKTPHLMFQSDQLITNFYANAKKVSWMSETGEPDL